MATDKKTYFALDLEGVYGIPQSTWRYWVLIGQGPPSYLLGRRRVWDRDVVEKWIDEQRNAGLEQMARDTLDDVTLDEPGHRGPA